MFCHLQCRVNKNWNTYLSSCLIQLSVKTGAHMTKVLQHISGQCTLLRYITEHKLSTWPIPAYIIFSKKTIILSSAWGGCYICFSMKKWTSLTYKIYCRNVNSIWTEGFKFPVCSTVSPAIQLIFLSGFSYFNEVKHILNHLAFFSSYLPIKFIKKVCHSYFPDICMVWNFCKLIPWFPDIYFLSPR